MVFLAPMAGITDRPFRRAVMRFGADLVFSEMIASHEIVQGKRDARQKAETGFAAKRTAVQLAGRDERWLAEAARLVERQGGRRIDINMGCPAKKVTGGLSGSALMRDLDHAARLIAAVTGAVSIPVSLKMRLGWDDDSRNAPELARRAEAAGVSMVTVHGRTRCQFYRGRADWKAVSAVHRAVAIPVVVNGDVADVPGARRALAESGAAGVMVGRQARGRPWLVAAIAAGLEGRTAPAVEAGDVAGAHYEDALSFYRAALGAKLMRKHLGWYLEAAGAPAGARSELLREEDPARVLRRLPRLLGREAAIAA